MTDAASSHVRPFSLGARLRSFVYAGRGIRTAIAGTVFAPYVQGAL